MRTPAWIITGLVVGGALVGMSLIVPLPPLWRFAVGLMLGVLAYHIWQGVRHTGRGPQ